MPHPESPMARGHLRLASPARPRRTRDSRILLLVRAALASLALLAASAVAWIVTAASLLPIVWRRAPLGRRVTPIRAREARIIQFQRRQALPR